MKVKVGDLFVTENKTCILVSKIGSDGMMYGYFHEKPGKEKGKEAQSPFGYLHNLEDIFENLNWVHYPVVK